MNMAEIPRLSLGELQVMPVAGGKEKEVYKMRTGDTVVAAKVYRDYEMRGADTAHPRMGKAINKEARATAEFNAYKQLLETPLGIYVPEPYFFLQDESGRVNGLAVQWIHGARMSDYATFNPGLLMDDRELEDMELRLEHTIQEGVYVDPDMFYEKNILRGAGDHMIYFAECEIAKTSGTEESRRDYTESGIIRLSRYCNGLSTDGGM